jgi:hypothetical protein
MPWFVPSFDVVHARLLEPVRSSLSGLRSSWRSLQVEQLMQEEVLEGSVLESWLTADNFDAGSLKQLTAYLGTAVNGAASKLSGN